MSTVNIDPSLSPTSAPSDQEVAQVSKMLDYVRGNLSEDEENQMGNHILGCASCQELHREVIDWEDEEALAKWVKENPEGVKASAGVLDKVIAEYNAKQN